MGDGRWPAPGMTSFWWCCCGRTWSTESVSDSAALRVLSTSRLPAVLFTRLVMSTSASCPIPEGRDRLLDCYSTTPGGTLYATTPGGQRAGLGQGRRLQAGLRLRAVVGRGVGRCGSWTRLLVLLQSVALGTAGEYLETKPSSLKPLSDATRPRA